MEIDGKSVNLVDTSLETEQILDLVAGVRQPDPVETARLSLQEVFVIDPSTPPPPDPISAPAVPVPALATVSCSCRLYNCTIACACNFTMQAHAHGIFYA